MEKRKERLKTILHIRIHTSEGRRVRRPYSFGGCRLGGGEKEMRVTGVTGVTGVLRGVMGGWGVDKFRFLSRVNMWTLKRSWRPWARRLSMICAVRVAIRRTIQKAIVSEVTWGAGFILPPCLTDDPYF